MRSQTPLAPSEPAFDVTVHIVLNDFGPLGRAYVETDETDETTGFRASAREPSSRKRL
jgi:hypothetical protein